MSKSREINLVPSFLNELHAFPANQTSMLWEKINFLQDDPLPDGKLKKKIKDKKSLFRLRVGDYRLFYTFGETWVRLLGIRKRDDQTYKTNLPESSKPVSPENAVDDLPEEVSTSPQKSDNSGQIKQSRQFDSKSAISTSALPFKITGEWLLNLKVPEQFHEIIKHCSTEEELLNIPIPPHVLERILDNMFPRDLEEIVNDTNFIIHKAEDLVQYKEKDLFSFLLKLDDEQKQFVDRFLEGPAMVKGGAGTGKSTVCLYRVKSMLENPKVSGTETLLFTTYTRALVSASQQLLRQILTEEQFSRVRVVTCDQMAIEVVQSFRKVGKIESGNRCLQVLNQTRKSFTPAAKTAFDARIKQKALAKLSDRYLLDEIEWIIEGRGISSLDDYLKTSRTGRKIAFQESLRESVWQLYEMFRSEVKKLGFERFSELRLEGLKLAIAKDYEPQFDFLVVDEAQDLSPVAANLITKMVKNKEGVFFAADNKQSIYSKNYEWMMPDPKLQFKGRTTLLKKNYRSTAEIDKAAFSILEPSNGDDFVVSKSIHTGPIPVLLKNVLPEQEGEWSAKYIKQMSKHLRLKTSASAVLVPSNKTGEEIAQALTASGLQSKYFAGRDLDLSEDVVKVITLYSAKGLEFPIVVLCGFDPATYPVETNFSDNEAYQEQLSHFRRLLYVGMTRAMRGLMVIQDKDCANEALSNMDETHWHIEEVE